MKVKLIISFLMVHFTTIYVKAQTEEKKIIGDSTIILGFITEDSYVGTSINDYCSIGYDKKLKEETMVFISGSTRCNKNYSSINYDFYEVIYNAKTYFIEKEKVFIKNYSFEDIKNLSEETANKFKNNTNTISKILYENEVDEAINALKNCKSAGLVIYDWSYYDESEYTEGTSANITVYNPTNKTIKYLWFSFMGFNPVGDKVIDSKSGSSIITKKAVGPIAKEETGTYEFEYVWFTDIVETAKIASIKVLYMDGTVANIKNPKLITLSEKYKNILEEAMNSLDELYDK